MMLKPPVHSDNIEGVSMLFITGASSSKTSTHEKIDSDNVWCPA